MADLSVEIGAKIDEFEKALNQSEKDLKNFEKTANKTNSNVSKSNTSAGKSFTSLGKNVASGSSAMTAFSRTIQDAPFGIMGVSNNITNLTEQFGYLQNKTGSAGGALKAMLRDLKGFGGISLAISAATSLMLVFGDEIEELLKTNNKLQTAFEESSESIGNQVNKLTSLVDALKDSNTSTEDKYKIIDKLNKDYPAYFSNLNRENSSIDNITTAYNKQKEALIGLGIAKALESKKAPEYAKLAELELKTASELLSATDKLAFSNLGGGISGAGIGGGTESSESIAKRLKELAEIRKQAEIKAIEDNIADIDKAVEKIRSKYNVSTSSFLGLENDNASGGVLPYDKEAIENTAKDIQHTFAQGAGDLGFLSVLDNTDYLDKALGGLQKHIDENLPTINPKIETEAFEEKLLMFSENVNNILQSGVINSFNSLGDSIGSALANGGDVMTAAAASLLSSLGSILKQLGTMALGVGLGIKAIKLSLKTLSPAAAIGAGIALIAIGSAVSAGASKLSNSMGSSSSGSYSGTASSSTSTFSGSSSTSYGGSSSSSGGTYVFEIQGTKLVGVINNTLKRNKSLGGTLSFG